MYLKITYGWFAEENRGKTADLDKALQDCLDKFGFFQTKARFDMANGERCLEFETEESIIGYDLDISIYWIRFILKIDRYLTMC